MSHQEVLANSSHSKAQLAFFFLIFDCAGSSCCKQAFSSFSEWGLFSSCGTQASHCSDISCCGAQALGYTGFSSCGSQGPECGLLSCGPSAQLPQGMWDLPRSGIEPVSLALQGRFSTTGPPGKSPSNILSATLNETQARRTELSSS